MSSYIIDHFNPDLDKYLGEAKQLLDYSNLMDEYIFENFNSLEVQQDKLIIDFKEEPNGHVLIPLFEDFELLSEINMEILVNGHSYEDKNIQIKSHKKPNKGIQDLEISGVIVKIK